MHNLIMQIIDKNGGQGYVTTDEFNDTINTAQYGYQTFLKGAVQQYQNGRPIARIDYSQNEKIRQQLTPCIFHTTLSVVGIGTALYPTGFVLVDAVLTSDNKVIRYAAQDKLANMLADEIDPVSENPIYTISNAGFTFYPSTLTNPQLWYVKVAPKIIYATTLDSNGREIYDQANSVDSIWNELDNFEIIVRALAIFGVPLQLPQVQNFAQNIKINGQ